jgi:hypothetical protein
MNIWTMWDLAGRQTTERRASAGNDHRHGLAARGGHKGLGLCCEPTPAQRRASSPGMWLRAAPVWVGYRMICLGCRLARPALVADALDRL